MNSCRLCKGNDITVIHKGTRDKSDIDVLKCNTCGFVFLSKIATDDKFYTDSQMRSEIDFNKWRENTFTDDSRRFSRFQNLIHKKNVLDFGCGNGGFLELVKKQGNPRCAVGVELDMECVHRLNDEGILCYGSISELPDIKFDIVFMFHVIEHLPHPEEVLHSLFDHVTAEGVIIMETPNADDALLSIYSCEKFADFTYWSPHIYLYNEHTLTKMLVDGGFEVTKIYQEQRYPLANHLRWLSKGLPGGGVSEFQELNDSEVNAAYARVLERQKACDTLISIVRRS